MILSTLTTFAIQASGLTNLWNSVLTSWITPAFIAIVAIVGIMLLVRKQWIAAISFIGLAAIAGVLVFAGNTFFGSNGNLTGAAKGLAKQINTVDGTSVVGGAIDTVTPNEFGD